MAAAMERTEVGLRKTGSSVTVPNDPKAKLMYYFNCICCLLEVDNSGNTRRLRDFRNYWRLSEEDTDLLMALCRLISPDELTNKIIFHSDEMCGDSSNEFYELSAVSHTFLVSDSIMIGGQRKTSAEDNVLQIVLDNEQLLQSDENSRESQPCFTTSPPTTTRTRLYYKLDISKLRRSHGPDTRDCLKVKIPQEASVH